MRDRTLIMVALIFLVLTIGAGVNKSLIACGRMTGEPLAPGFNEIYREKRENVRLFCSRIVKTGEVLLERAERKKNDLVH
ncbi:hypothetical protein [Phosphitispora fastidiosa]|uniref:hypothetical protein n=1 Tax=Phosphitispora fastidiosa TaxID=2837202 RepID=UPI001E3009FC|nr:hypothetical protein [Phosphitispora fastidiosa]MBU7005914.1 hypothetical protein [Phosphitispora fastidiosa]